ncbi:MFS transporter, partial [Klebsiella pneumoniae]|nr:MFS transporter [Klebsiella pneumoniae]
MIVIAASKSHEHETVDVVRSVDTMWRWVIGIGVIPGAIATLFRFAIPESPRFLMEVEDDPIQAEFDAT